MIADQKKAMPDDTNCECKILDDGSHVVIEEKWEHARYAGLPPSWRKPTTERWTNEDGTESR